MKKLKFLISSILISIFLGSIIGAIFLNNKVHADEADLTKSYLELTTSELDSLSRRTNTSTSNPQITVFTQGRVTDHRIGMTLYNLPDFIMGDIEEMLDALAINDREKKLASQED